MAVFSEVASMKQNRTVWLFQSRIQRRRIVQQDPLNNRKRQVAILDQVARRPANREKYLSIG
jgi:hypothetical protein